MTTTTALSPWEDRKIQGQHRDRFAVVYVRQSTLQQMVRHQESTRLQYGLVERALAFGWARSQVLVIDEDLGKSGATAEGRPGFQRLVAEVSLAHVGIVFGLDISRLARSNRDWHQLLEVCALFGTLIGDLDGIYDPRDYNDRLLLGLKGTMSEAEGHVLKQRMLAGKRAKAQRGELGMQLPMGYSRRLSGDVVKDPDEQAQAVIHLIFEQFERQTTIGGVLRYCVRHGVQLPYRLASGPAKGELVWRRPTRHTLSSLLHHPMYAGAYVYGRRHTDPRHQQPGRPMTGRRVTPQAEWQVLLKERYPAYITWEQFERHQRQLTANATTRRGVIRPGASLLAGLLLCGRCGCRMMAMYTNSGTGLRYVCSRAASEYGAPLCQSFVGQPLDTLVARLVLQALEPAALELSLRVAADVEAERQQLQQHWHQRLERVRYEVERACRQYQAVEPENRLVARTLERQWEAALAAEATVQAEYTRFLAQQPVPLAAQDREAIRRLAADIPALWHAPTTTAADHQAIIRQLVERIVVTLEGATEQVALTLYWAGGHTSTTTLDRPVARLEQLSYYPTLVHCICTLHAQGLKAPAIAQTLNAEGWRPPKRRTTFTADTVRSILVRQGLWTPRLRTRTVSRRPHEWTILELAHQLQMPHQTLYAWVYKGHLKARRTTRTRHPLWLVYADPAELARLRALRPTPALVRTKTP
jgi:DNA invertase Pin-like site-specific DNA recombinase